ncbi:MAG: hypothetical protein JSW71_12150 [Gemmatimonadota bacterium]|nr:MAG: hypothetical protein JSW71_12150 [Gemmatimonadota bacterium]
MDRSKLRDQNPSQTSVADGGTDLSRDEIRGQLERILGHSEFDATDRLREFLRFVVTETLAGRAFRLKGYTIATEVFGRPKDFDAASDPIVRVEAGRLRRALERYYLVAGGEDPIRIDIPKGHYVPRFSRQPIHSRHALDLREADREVDRPAEPTIAILPFRCLCADEDELFFVNGLVEELVTEVNRYQDIVAVQCQGVASGNGFDVRLVARFLLDGSIRRDASTVKLATALTDQVTGRQIWADSRKIDLDPGNMIALQEDIARDAVAAIAGEYGVIAKRLSLESRSKPPEALSTYEAMLRYHHYMLVTTPQAAEEAFAALHQATQREPDYGPAWSALANLFAVAYAIDEPGIDSPLESATAHAHRGVALEPESQLARTAMALVYLLRGELEEFREEAQIALALNPSSPNHTGAIGFCFAHAGDLDRAHALLERAMALNPCHPSWFHHGICMYYYHRGDYDAAHKALLKVGFQLAYWEAAMKAAVLGKLGRLSEAREAVQEVLKLKPDFEYHAREVTARTLKACDLLEDFLDGLRRAGLSIDESPSV